MFSRLFGRPVSKIDELTKVLKKDPASRQFLALAEEYRKEGKLREAAETLERGLAYNPSYVTASVALGRTCQQLNRIDDAIKAYTNALKYDKENLVAIRQLADAYLKKGEKIEAIKKLKLYRGLKPGDRDVDELITALDAELNPRKAVQTAQGPPPPPVFAAPSSKPSMPAYLERSGPVSRSGEALPPPPVFFESTKSPVDAPTSPLGSKVAGYSSYRSGTTGPIQPPRQVEIAAPPDLRARRPSEPLGMDAAPVAPSSPVTSPVARPALPEVEAPRAAPPPPFSPQPSVASARAFEERGVAPPSPPSPPVVPARPAADLLEMTYDGSRGRKVEPADAPGVPPFAPAEAPGVPPFAPGEAPGVPPFAPASAPGVPVDSSALSTGVPAESPRDFASSPFEVAPGEEQDLEIPPAPEWLEAQREAARSATVVDDSSPAGISSTAEHPAAESDPFVTASRAAISLPDVSLVPPPFVDEPVPSEDDPFADAATSVPVLEEEVISLAPADVSAASFGAAAEVSAASFGAAADVSAASFGAAAEVSAASFGAAAEVSAASFGAAAEKDAFFDSDVAVAQDGEAETESVFGDAPSVDSGAAALVSPTLAALYEQQGYHHDAGSVLQSLADRAASPDLARQLSQRARAEASRSLQGLPRLRSLAANLPVSPRLQLEDLHSSLKGLSAIPGVTSGALTDSEGLPVVAFSNDGDDVASEAVAAELTAFWKALNRSAEELGGGAARFFTVTAGDTVAAVCRISEAYALILRAEASVPLGQLRYEAMRTASRLSPLLG